MKTLTITFLLGLLVAVIAMGGDAKPDKITRIPLLTAVFNKELPVSRIEIKKIVFNPLQETGLHLHPCPVVGYLVKGTINFQVDGEPGQNPSCGRCLLRTG